MDLGNPIPHVSDTLCSRFLYQGREVSYSSVLDRSISTRRAQLYKSRGLDVDKWSEMVLEEKALRREVSKIAEDYGVEINHVGEEIANSTSTSSTKSKTNTHSSRKEEESSKGDKEETTGEDGQDKGNEDRDKYSKPPERDAGVKS